MNIALAKERRSDILKVDSINTTNADFMITHVPFKSILVRRNLQSDKVEHLSEEQIFGQFFVNPDVYEHHQFIVVDGSSGSGKSHFIRWLNAKLQPLIDKGSDVVLLIRRSDNTLKGTLRQLLNNEAISKIKNRDIYERLVKANQTISESKFKEKIYAEFIVEINTSDNNDILSRVQKKQLVALLNNDQFKDRMMTLGGPIDRIYQKVAGDDTTVNSVDALFIEDDFILDTDVMEELRRTADTKARMLGERLIPDDDGESLAPKITSFMNMFVDKVVQSCAGIETGDFQAIFKEIRQELRKQNKNLILLVEDITAFTGINQDLLNALETEHTGLNEADNLCRLISVVGTTTQYYSEFRDNYKDRITTQFTIEDGAIGEKNGSDVVLFFAKYLNALSLSEEVIQEWYNNGAQDSDYPIHMADCQWDSVKYGTKALNLFPFTVRSINALYHGMSVQKTPRYIIREIIEPAVNDLIADKGIFPIFLRSWRHTIKENFESRILDSLSKLQLGNDRNVYKECLLALISYWGDGTFDINLEKRTIAGISKLVYDKFGFKKFANLYLGDKEGEKLEPEPVVELQPEPEPVYVSITEPKLYKVQPVSTNKKYDDFKNLINAWFYDGTVLNKAREIRDALCSFVFDTLNWQQLGVSLELPNMVKNSSVVNLFAIEDQDRANAKGLIELKRNEETKEVLLAIGKYLYLGNKSWQFVGAPEAIYTLTCWLELHKKGIVKAVTEQEPSVPTYIECSLLAHLIYLSLTDRDIKRAADITVDKILTFNSAFSNDKVSHSKEWKDLLAICNNDNAAKTNYERIVNYFNIIQGTAASKKYINYRVLENALKKLMKNQFEIDFSQINSSVLKDKKDAVEYCKKIYERVENVVKDEIAYVSALLSSLLTYFGYEEDDDINASDVRDILNSISNMYNKADQYGVNLKNLSFKCEQLKNISNQIAQTISSVKADFMFGGYLSGLMKYSNVSIKDIEELNSLFITANSDVDNLVNYMTGEKDRLVRSGNWIDNVDPRFAEVLQDFDDIDKEL